MEAFVEAPVEVTSVEPFMSSILLMKASTNTSVEVTFVKASITSAKASITSMKTSMMEDFVELSSMESFVEALLETPVEATFVEVFISSMEVFTASISSMEASMEDSIASIFSMEASMGALKVEAFTSFHAKCK